MSEDLLELVIEKIKTRKALKPHGYCHACEAKFLPFSQQLFCNGHCREDFELEQQRRKQ